MMPIAAIVCSTTWVFELNVFYIYVMIKPKETFAVKINFFNEWYGNIDRGFLSLLFEGGSWGYKEEAA